MSTDLMHAHVAKSNSLIDASYRLSVQEHRIVLAAISQVRRDEAITDEVMYSVEVSALADLARLELNNTYRDLKEAALRLKRREVRIEKEPDGKNKKRKVLVTGWVQSIAYIDSEARIELRFTKDVLPYINQLSSNYTRYMLKDVVSLSSVHAIRLYEMIVRWRNTSNECEIDIECFKQSLQIADDYPRIFDLKKRVIEPAVEQINEHSDMKVTWSQRKTGRAVTHLKFTFAQKKTSGAKPGATRKRKVLSDSELAAFARPGETREQALTRYHATK